MRRELELLREKMREIGVDACLIPTSDFHGSEYVGDYFKCREYISGFTGSAGTLVVTLDEAGLWTDGRYFLQAAKQLEGSGIMLRKERQPGVPAIEEYLKQTLKRGETLGFDGRCIMQDSAEKLITQLNAQGVAVRTDIDLTGAVWKNRPELSAQPVWPLPVEYAGESSESKIKRVREFLVEKKADYFLLTSLEDIAWLLNMRGIAGAASVTGVDASQLAVDQATANATLNGLSDNVKFICEDVFELLPELEEKGEKFDVVILDPPAFTKSRNSIKNAVKGYREINLRAMKLVKDGGFLATCSCSHFMDYELFTKTIGQAAKNVHKRLRQVEYRTQAPDHPILWAADESYYLKFYIFQVCNDR